MTETTNYFDIKAYSFSLLKTIIPPNTPAHFFKELTEKKEQTEAMKEGTATHYIILQKDEFDKRYILYENPFDDYRKFEARLARDKFIEDNKTIGRDVILGREAWDNLFERRNACWQNKTSEYLLNHPNAIIEKGIVWIDKETGVELKAKPDIISTPEICCDVKTMQCVNDHALSKEISERLMFMQAAMYVDGIKKVYDYDIKRYYIIAIEKPNNLVRCEFISQEDIETGRQLYRWAIVTAENCRMNNNYHGYVQGVDNPISLNNYRMLNIRELLNSSVI